MRTDGFSTEKIRSSDGRATFWRENNWASCQTQKRDWRHLMAGKKSVCATRGILWKMMAFQPFHVWNYNYILQVTTVTLTMKHSPRQEIPKPETQLKRKLTIIII